MRTAGTIHCLLFSARVFPHVCAHLLGRIEKAQSRIQALQGDSKPSSAPAPALPPKKTPQPQKPKKSKSAKQDKTKGEQSKAARVEAKPGADAAPSAPVVETVAAAAAGYSANYGWCQVKLAVGPNATGVSSGTLDTRQMGSASSTVPIVGGKCSENSAGPNEFVAWETQRTEVASPQAMHSGPSTGATEAERKASNRNAAFQKPSEKLPIDPQTPDSVEDSPKTRKVKNLADASLDSPNTRKAREEIMVCSCVWSNPLRLQCILGLDAQRSRCCLAGKGGSS
eukprot:COSAG02_NODE_2695_length_8214_cov_12.071842_3_plen_283_part_00